MSVDVGTLGEQGRDLLLHGRRRATPGCERYRRGFPVPAAHTYAQLAAERRQAGRPMAQFDAQIAAIARSRGAALATRNVMDFEGCGVHEEVCFLRGRQNKAGSHQQGTRG
ncbi:MAG TPA: hypothetical protein VE735_09655 [Gammaproteobacteria bacterium]|nr:hypothetical protein [Gammaproteobacteria bacterium]